MREERRHGAEDAEVAVEFVAWRDGDGSAVGLDHVDGGGDAGAVAGRGGGRGGGASQHLGGDGGLAGA